jgi:hypothetical protein
VSAPFLVTPGRERRRAGNALLAYGLVGVILLTGLFLVLGYAGLKLAANADQIAAARDELVTTLDRVMTALDRAATTMHGAAVSLRDSSEAIGEASSLASIAAGGGSKLATTAQDFGILGQKPFAGVAGDLGAASESLSRLSGQLETISGSVATNATDVGDLATSVSGVSTALAANRDRIASVPLDAGGPVLVVTIVMLLLIAWLAVPAFAALWIGRRWRRENPSTTPEARPASAA